VSDTIQFLGRTLKRSKKRANEIGDTWSTPWARQWPVLSVGQDINGYWFAFIHLRGQGSISTRLKPTREAAMAEVAKEARWIAEDLKGLEL